MAHEEGDEDGGVHHDQGQNSSPTVAETVGDRSRQKDSDKSTALTGLEKRWARSVTKLRGETWWLRKAHVPQALVLTTLPSGGNCICVVADGNTIPPLEVGKGHKVAVQKHVETFHDLIRGISSSYFHCN